MQNTTFREIPLDMATIRVIKDVLENRGRMFYNGKSVSKRLFLDFLITLWAQGGILQVALGKGWKSKVQKRYEFVKEGNRIIAKVVERW